MPKGLIIDKRQVFAVEYNFVLPLIDEIGILSFSPTVKVITTQSISCMLLFAVQQIFKQFV